MDELIFAGLAGGDRMPPRVALGAGIASVAMSLPGRKVSSEEVAARADVTTEWILERTGVSSRRYAEPEDMLADYAAEAGTAALHGAGVDPAEVDLVLVATMSHEYMTPSASALAAERMGCKRAGSMDVNAACTGFVSALALASGQIESGRCETIVVIGADLLSRLVDPTDRGTAALFGDGAGAVVLRRVDGPSRVRPAIFGTDGSRSNLIETGREEGIIKMKGPDTYKQAVDRLSESTLAAVEAAGLGLGDIDLFAFHQANARILTAVGERLGLDPERVIESIGECGNTSAASIPMALAHAGNDGRLHEGAKVLLAAFGGGLAWGATVVEWGVADAS